MRKFVAIALAAALGGCASISDLKEDGPDFRVSYSPGDPVAMRDCVQSKMIKAADGRDAPITYEDGEKAILYDRHESHAGPMGVLMVAEFYRDHANVFGKSYIGGQYGSEVPPMIQACADQL